MPTTIPAGEVQAAKQYRARRPNLKFREMGIPVGAEHHFIEGGDIVPMSDERKVRLDDEEISLTAAARQLLGLDDSVAPGRYLNYRRKSISTIYEETYGQQA